MTRSRRTLRAMSRIGLTALLVATAAIVGSAISPTGDPSVQAVGSLSSGGEYQPLDPERIFDSRVRALDVSPFGVKRFSTSSAPRVFEVPVVGRGGLPAFTDADGDGADDNVLAVALTITVVDASGNGYLRAFGTGATEGNTSVVNFVARTPVPNSTLLRPGRDGKISIRLVGAGGASGNANVFVDVSGWISSSTYGTPGARVIPISPARVYDSQLAQFGGKPIGTGAQVKIPIRGASQVDRPGTPVVPSGGEVIGVVLNLTGDNRFPGSRQTFVSALPERWSGPAGSLPSTSNLNLVPGVARANLAMMPVGADGSIHLFNRTGQIRLIVDIVGYLETGRPSESREGRVVPLVAPFRALDTREPEFFRQPLGPARAEDWSFESFVDDVRIGAQPVGAQLGLIANLTGTNLQRQYSWAPVTTYVAAFPTPSSGSAVPTVSNVNLTEALSVPNMALLTYGERLSDDRCLDRHCVRFYNRAGYVDYLLDVSAVILADE